MKKVILLLVFSLILVSGISGCSENKPQCVNDLCTLTSPVTDADFAVSECEKLCQEAIITKNLSSECLGDPLSDVNWVCDVAHSPRILEDDLVENQCQSYLNKTSRQFVELTSECKLIRLD